MARAPEKRPSAPVGRGQGGGAICEQRGEKVLKGTQLQRALRGQETHGIGLQLGWCRPGSSSTSLHGPEEFGFSAILWRPNRWNTPTIGLTIIWRGHSQGATNPVENAILWRWRAPLGLLLRLLIPCTAD